jgi:hypothetical protein
MIFENEKAYFIKKHTSNKTNTKSYDLLNGDFIFEATFKYTKNKDYTHKEQCVVGRCGYNMGLFIQDDNYVKWVWWEMNDGGEYVYRDIFMDDVNLNKFNTIRVVKNNDEFIVFLNDSWYFNGKIEGKLYDYSDKVIYIGVANPYCENKNECWFSGEISDVKIYNSSNETLDDLYAWFDFEMISNFKIYDKSGNGNHGERFESNKIKEKHNIEYNKFARPAKII